METTQTFPDCSWQYVSSLEEYDRTKVKIHHSAVHRDTGEEKIIHHSPYQAVTKEAFYAYVTLGFPSRLGTSSFTNESIIALARFVANFPRAEAA